MNILYITLKHVVWRFRIRNYFREIFKFRDFMNTLRNFAKSVFAHIFAKFEYNYCSMLLLNEEEIYYLCPTSEIKNN